MSAGTPLLWQYNFSNYNEKARWALDYKGIDHRRRSLMPGEPRAMAFSLRGTLPTLDLDGVRYGDSTEIIAALERLRPEPAVYPVEAAQRSAALALEDYFDEEVGHALRRAFFWEIHEDRGYMIDFISAGQPAAMKALLKLTFPLGWLYVSRRYAFTDEDAERAWVTLEGALDRIEVERAGGDYLVGDTFTVADLTAASLLWPLAWPDQFQYELPRLPANDRIDRLAAHPAAQWVGEMFRRHRGRSHEID